MARKISLEIDIWNTDLGRVISPNELAEQEGYSLAILTTENSKNH